MSSPETIVMSSKKAKQNGFEESWQVLNTLATASLNKAGAT